MRTRSRTLAYRGLVAAKNRGRLDFVTVELDPCTTSSLRDSHGVQVKAVGVSIARKEKPS